MPFDGGGFILGPLIALLMIGALALVLKWTFTGVPDDKMPAHLSDPAPPRMMADARPRPYPDGAAQRAPSRTGTDTDDYGLLKTVAVVDAPAAAAEVRDQLTAAGIRTTVAAGAGGRIRVLVFGSDLTRAYDVLNS